MSAFLSRRFDLRLWTLRRFHGAPDRDTIQGNARTQARAVHPRKRREDRMSDAEPRDTAEAGGWEPYPADGVEGSTVKGSVRVMRGVTGPRPDDRRDLLVYLPPSYDTGRRRYPVVYMHDGQNLFDRATSFSDEWEVDQTLDDASRHGLECIVVGVPNLGDARLDEYGPWPDHRHKAGGRAADYVRWLTETVKPRVDADFRTRPGRECTGVAGSSMGGLVSLYAFFARSDVFGFAGVMSPALWFGDGAALPWVAERPWVPGRLYLDVGTSEGTDELRDVRRLKDLLAAKGYAEGRDLLYVVEMGGQHNERAWARRLRREMHFLLGVPQPAPRREVRMTGAL